MNYIENTKKEIREIWFKGHTILETKGELGLQMIAEQLVSHARV